LTDLSTISLPLLAAFFAGAVNALAGGGTMLTFPALMGAGFGAAAANATSTAGLFPAQLASLAGLREHMAGSRVLAIRLMVCGMIGGLLGAWLLTVTPERWFGRMVPFLILTATAIFIGQERLVRRVGQGSEAGQVSWNPAAVSGLFATAVYGGYFGAGIGILTLAVFGMVGLRDIHRMNALKSMFTVGANAIAAIVFLVRGSADLATAAPMAIVASLGGYTEARFGKRIGAKNVRRFVAAVGLVLGLVQLVGLWK